VVDLYYLSDSEFLHQFSPVLESSIPDRSLSVPVIPASWLVIPRWCGVCYSSHTSQQVSFALV